ncbi:MAG: RNA 2',3'-cyclic phosphodiesterase [Advenella sp.]
MRITDGKPDIRGETARIFFAIWPDSAAKKQLTTLAERLQAGLFCSGRKTQPENLHLTLVFLGEIDASKLDVVCLAADGVKRRARAFDVVIEEIRYWKHNGIAYAAIGRIPRELGELVNALQDALSAAGFSIERARAYQPHITLMRKASCHALPQLAVPIAWRAREWRLVKSTQTSNGPVYIPIGRWPLA